MSQRMSRRNLNAAEGSHWLRSSQTSFGFVGISGHYEDPIMSLRFSILPPFLVGLSGTSALSLCINSFTRTLISSRKPPIGQRKLGHRLWISFPPCMCTMTCSKTRQLSRLQGCCLRPAFPKLSRSAALRMMARTKPFDRDFAAACFLNHFWFVVQPYKLQYVFLPTSCHISTTGQMKWQKKIVRPFPKGGRGKSCFDFVKKFQVPTPFGWDLCEPRATAQQLCKLFLILLLPGWFFNGRAKNNRNTRQRSN